MPKSVLFTFNHKGFPSRTFAIFAVRISRCCRSVVGTCGYTISELALTEALRQKWTCNAVRTAARKVARATEPFGKLTAGRAGHLITAAVRIAPLQPAPEKPEGKPQPRPEAGTHIAPHCAVFSHVVSVGNAHFLAIRTFFRAHPGPYALWPQTLLPRMAFV